MTIRIIDNKKIDLTADEFNLFEKIAKSYTTRTLQGEDLFKGLFETDKNGIIKFLRPPSKNFTSLEVYLFVLSVFVRQNVGLACIQSDELAIETRTELLRLQEDRALLASELAELRELKLSMKG